MDARSDWIDDIAGDTRYEWTRIGRYRVETMLAPEVPCQIMVGDTDGEPVLYLAVGHNASAHYWQWASVDRDNLKPLPRSRALDDMWFIIEGAIERTRSEVVPELRGWETAVV